MAPFQKEKTSSKLKTICQRSCRYGLNLGLSYSHHPLLGLFVYIIWSHTILWLNITKSLPNPTTLALPPQKKQIIKETVFFPTGSIPHNLPMPFSFSVSPPFFGWKALRVLDIGGGYPGDRAGFEAPGHSVKQMSTQKICRFFWSGPVTRWGIFF